MKLQDQLPRMPGNELIEGCAEQRIERLSRLNSSYMINLLVTSPDGHVNEFLPLTRQMSKSSSSCRVHRSLRSNSAAPTFTQPGPWSLLMRCLAERNSHAISLKYSAAESSGLLRKVFHLPVSGTIGMAF